MGQEEGRCGCKKARDCGPSGGEERERRVERTALTCVRGRVDSAQPVGSRRMAQRLSSILWGDQDGGAGGGGREGHMPTYS